MTKRVYGGGRHTFNCWGARLKLTKYEEMLALRNEDPSGSAWRWLNTLKGDLAAAVKDCGCVSDDFPKKGVAEPSPSRSKIPARKRLTPFFKGRKR